MLLEEYENLHFIKKDGSYDVTPCPKRNTDPFLREGFLFSSNEIWKKEGCKVYPPEYFSPIDYETKKIKITENTYSIHHYMASWIPKEEKELAKELSDIKARYNKIYAMVLMQRKKYKFDKNKGNCKNLFGYIIMKIKKKSFMKNSIYNMLYEIVNLLFPFVTSQYLSRILLPEGVGKVASVQNMVSYFVTIAALGIPSYGVREGRVLSVTG